MTVTVLSLLYSTTQHCSCSVRFGEQSCSFHISQNDHQSSTNTQKGHFKPSHVPEARAHSRVLDGISVIVTSWKENATINIQIQDEDLFTFINNNLRFL